MFPFVDVQGLGGAWTLGTVQTGEFDLVHRASLKGGFGDDAVEMNRHLLPGAWEQDSGWTVDEWTPWQTAYVCGTPPCFASGTIVLTARGTIPIEDVVVGDLVYTHMRRWRRVLRTGQKRASTIRVAKMTECTPDHKWYSAPWNIALGKNIDQDFISWIPAEELQGKALAMPNSIACPPIKPPTIPQFDSATSPWWVIGRWLGDGWTRTSDHGVYTTICCGNHESEILGERLGPSWRRYDETSTSKFSYSHKDLVFFLDSEFGKYAYGKRLPAWLFSLSREEKQALFDGYVSADGSERRNEGRSGGVGRALVVGMRLLAVDLGYSTSITPRKVEPQGVIEGRVVNQRPSWTLAHFINDGRYSRDQDGLRWTKCRKPIEQAAVQQVWDLEVEEDHSYTADGFIVKNCSGFSNANTTSLRGPGAPINRCMRQLIEYAGHCVGTDGRPGPEIVAFESVQAAYTKGRSLMQTLRDLLESLTGQEYDLHHVLMSGGSVGAAQYRHRYFPIFARIPFGVDPPTREELPDQKTVTYFDAIGDLQGLDITWDGQPRRYAPTSEFGKRLVDVDEVTQHVTAEGRQAIAIKVCHEAGWPAGKYLSEAFDILDVHLPEFERNRKPNGIRRGDSTYKGLQWPLKVNPNKSGYVQTGGCVREFAHWAEPRFLTVRELTRMMGYPDSWRWPEAITKASAYIGKPLALETPILTANNGWQTMETVKVGDTVFAGDGSQTVVDAVTPIKEDDAYELEFYDGSTIIASADHDWSVFDTRTKQSTTLMTKEIAATDQSKHRYHVQCDGILQSETAELPIDPYIFGYWLGDGGRREAKMTVGADDKQALCQSIKDAGYEIISEYRRLDANAFDVRFNDPGRKHKRDGVQPRLRELGVLADDLALDNYKRIPVQYLLASAAQRRELLRGLMDSDGSIATSGKSRGAIEIGMTDKILMIDVHQLIRSLGIKATLTQRPARSNGRTLGTRYGVTWTPRWNPFRLERKAVHFIDRDNYTGPDLRSRLDLMSITRITDVGRCRVRCILIDDDSHLFLAGRTFIPTHNCCPVDSGRWASRWAAEALHGRPGKLGKELQDGTGEYYYQFTLMYRQWF